MTALPGIKPPVGDTRRTAYPIRAEAVIVTEPDPAPLDPRIRAAILVVCTLLAAVGGALSAAARDLKAAVA